MTFEKGERGITVIIPNLDLDQGFTKAGEFHKRILNKLPASFTSKTDFCIGLSSRSGRLINGERLFFEANAALDKALQDPAAPIIAFKSDPEKYRKFIKQERAASGK
jgi:hypothetical protein